MMSTPSTPERIPWRDFYKAALFESDPARLPEHIKRAESAIVARARQLFDQQGDHIEEELALDDALYALQALRSCLQSRSSAAA
jgi:hypothetical protein